MTGACGQGPAPPGHGRRPGLSVPAALVVRRLCLQRQSASRLGRRPASRCQWFIEAGDNTAIQRGPDARSGVAPDGHGVATGTRHLGRPGGRSLSTSSAATRSRSSCCCRLRCRASSPASPLRTTFTTFDVSTRSDDDHRRPRHLLRGRRLQQRLARLRRLPGSLEEASADLGADSFTTFRNVTMAGIGSRRSGRRIARVRAVVRRDHRHHLHRRRRHADDPDVDLCGHPAAERAAGGQRRRPRRWCSSACYPRLHGVSASAATSLGPPALNETRSTPYTAHA